MAPRQAHDAHDADDASYWRAAGFLKYAINPTKCSQYTLWAVFVVLGRF